MSEHPSPNSTASPVTGQDTGEWTTTIQPQRGWFDWRLGELVRHRELIALFVWRDFASHYKQTVLGPLWHIVQPLLTTLTFTLVFGRIARLPTDGTPPFLFYMAGNVVWSYFATCLTKTSGTLLGNAHLLGKVYFHRLSLPVSIVISALVAFGIQLSLFLAFLIWYALSGTSIPVNAWALLTPVWALMLAGFALGGGITVAALTTRYRDLGHVVAFGVQLLMYATPVLYPSSAIPEKYRAIAVFNPLTPVIEAFRSGFLGTPAPAPWQLAYSVGCLAVLLLVGLILFTRVERTFLDTV